MYDDPFAAQWYEVNGIVVGFNRGVVNEAMVIMVTKWRPKMDIVRSGGWVHTQDGRLPMFLLLPIDNEYVYHGDPVAGEIVAGDIVSFETNRKEQDDYIRSLSDN
jgi:hypothetical protein